MISIISVLAYIRGIPIPQRIGNMVSSKKTSSIGSEFLIFMYLAYFVSCRLTILASFILPTIYV